jgi:N-acetylglucosamine-6-phosphate deacetylase
MPDTYLITGANLIDNGAEHPGAALAVEGGRIRYAGPATHAPADLPRLSLPEWSLAPGFIDIQLNGAYGHDFTGDPHSIAAVAQRLPKSGVTAFLPTFITSPLESYAGKLRAVQAAQAQMGGMRIARDSSAATSSADPAADPVGDPASTSSPDPANPASGASASPDPASASPAAPPSARVLGAHLEGPFLSPDSPGAHDASLFRQPTLDAIQSYTPLDAVRLVTLAPELPGALEAAAWLIQHGVTVSAGHTRLSASQAEQAFAAGVLLATHLFNAMPPLHHREPGLIGSLFDHPHARTGLIADGIHAHSIMLRLAFRCLGAGRIVLVTDAMSAMGMPPGRYTIGGQVVVVDQTSARLENGTLAGSILSMDQAVRNMVSLGVCSLPEALRTASQTPAEALGLGGSLGRLLPGYPADFVLLDEDLVVQGVFIGGRLAYASSAAGRLFQKRGFLDGDSIPRRRRR